MVTVVPLADLRRSPTAALFEGGEVPVSIFVTQYARGRGRTCTCIPTPRSSWWRPAPRRSPSATRSTIVDAGNIVVVPPQTPHGFKGAGDDTLRVVSVHPSGAVEQVDLTG